LKPQQLHSPKIQRLSVSLFLLASMNVLHAQVVLKGKITDAANDALIGALVTVNNTTEGTVTNIDGEFELRTAQVLPLTITISFDPYPPFTQTVNDAKFITVKFERTTALKAVEVEGKGPVKNDSPLARTSMSVSQIENRAAPDLYAEIGTQKEIDPITASLGFQILNTRGFNSTSPVRMLQIIDGVDNQSPGLNFSLGNFLGTSELDIMRLEVISGASGPFYGPNAFNGVISQETKDPFIYTGLQVMMRAGERNLFESALRYAQVFNNKNGQGALAYKINLYGLTAHDWVADNTDPVTGSKVPADNPGRYDAVNIYGDESYYRNDFSGLANEFLYPGLGIFYRTGYHENDLVDYNTKNLKGNLALQWRPFRTISDCSA
jgi:iron complex outermembrane receptor protein